MDRSMRIGIVSSAIATVLFMYLLDPILRAVTFVLFSVLGSAARWYTDGLFERAALLLGPDPSLSILSFLTGMVCAVFSIAAAGILLWRQEDPEALLPRWFKKEPSRIIRGSIATVAVVLLSSQILILHRTMFCLRITTSFDQHIATVAPFITDQEVKLLRSRWTQMSSERDYRAIYSDLDRIAKSNNVRLPENKLYSFSSF